MRQCLYSAIGLNSFYEKVQSKLNNSFKNSNSQNITKRIQRIKKNLAIYVYWVWFYAEFGNLELILLFGQIKYR